MRKLILLALASCPLMIGQILSPIVAGKAPSIQLVAFGDSITLPLGGGALSASSQSYVQVLASLITARQHKPVKVTQEGLGGSSWNYSLNSPGTPTMAGDLPGVVGAAAGASSKLVLFAGTNGLKLGGHTPAQEYSAFQGVLSTLLTEGYVGANIVVVTMLPRENYSDTNRLSYNSLLEGGAATYGYSVVALENNTDFGIQGTQSLPNWYPLGDQIHPGQYAHLQMAYSIYDAMYPGYPWTPTTTLLTNPDSSIAPALYMWYDLQDSNTVTQSGGKVSAWNDKSGNGLHLTQASGSLQPTYTASGMNGHPSLTFTGGSTYLRNSSLSSFDLTNTSTAVVFQWNGTAANGHLVLWEGSSALTWSTGLALRVNNSSPYVVVANDAHGGQGLPYCTGVNTGTNIGNNPLSSGTWTGTLTTTEPWICDGSDHWGTNPVTVTVNYFQVGDSIQLNNYAFQGQIGEALIVAGKATAYDRLKLAAYLKAKWL